MYTDFTIKNFRIFDKEGTTIPLRPVTILTGCNNTGKSTIVKALCLLKSYCQQLEAAHEDGKRLSLGSYKMDFNTSPNSLLGSFDLVLHHNTGTETLLSDTIVESQESSVVSFELEVESSWLLQNVIVHLDFGVLEGDELNNGYLQEYSIRTLEGKTIYKAKRDGHSFMDFSIVKKSFLYFLYGQYSLAQWQSTFLFDEVGIMDADIPDLKSVGDILDKMVKSIYGNLGSSALVTLFEWQANHCFKTWKDGCTGSANPILENMPDPSFYIGSPTLGVFCYYPCLDFFKDMKKSEVINEISKRINEKKQAKSSNKLKTDTSVETISSLEKKIIYLFISAFEESKAETLHEFVSEKENERFFVNSDIKDSRNKSFAFPNSSLLGPTVGAISRESDLPKSANWIVVIMAMQAINRLITETPNSYVSFDKFNSQYHYFVEHEIDKYCGRIIEDVLVNLLPGYLIYSPISVVELRRMYSLEDKSDFSETLKAYFDTKRLWNNDKDSDIDLLYRLSHRDELQYQPCSFINKWLKQLGVAHHVEIKSHANASAATIHLYESENDEKGMLLCDKGYGVLQLFAILLKIEIAIINTKLNEGKFPSETRGIDEEFAKILRSYANLHPYTIALEEPECHMHPSLQSKIADMIVEANKNYGIHFIIESHSEYFIRKLQLLVSQKEIDNDEVSLLYVNPADRPFHLPIITDIGMDSDGVLKNEFGHGFFDESFRLSKELFKFKTDDDEE